MSLELSVFPFSWFNRSTNYEFRRLLYDARFEQCLVQCTFVIRVDNIKCKYPYSIPRPPSFVNCWNEMTYLDSRLALPLEWVAPQYDISVKKPSMQLFMQFSFPFISHTNRTASINEVPWHQLNKTDFFFAFSILLFRAASYPVIG